MRKYTKNKPTFPSEESLAKSLFLGILKVEKKWTSKVQNWGIIYSQLTIWKYWSFFIDYEIFLIQIEKKIGFIQT